MIIYGLITTTKKTVPLTRRDIQFTLRPTGVNITEKLLFMNTQKEDIETEFRYPMKKGRVNGLRFRVEDGDWQIMTVEEKIKAETTYNNAVSSGHQAVLGSLQKMWIKAILAAQVVTECLPRGFVGFW